MEDTEKILLEYCSLEPSNEGLVYWGGKRDGDFFTISAVIAPATTSDYGRVSTSNRANFDVVRTLNQNKFVEIAQVHSHPGDWVDHSLGDDERAAFKFIGLISVVVPNYGLNGMMPLCTCGVHRYSDNDFIRFSDSYVKNHFLIKDDLEEYIFVDQRST